MTSKEILFRIREQREKLHLTQQAIATELDLETKSYSNIENGVTELSLTRFLIIAKILQTPPEYFINPAHNFTFDNCQQSGYLNNPVFQNEVSKGIIEVEKQVIQHLEEEIKYLRTLIDKLSK